MRWGILLFIISSGAILFAQTPWKCPAYEGGLGTLNELISNEFPSFTEADSIFFEIRISYVEGKLYHYEVKSNVTLPQSLMTKLEKTKNKWMVEIDIPDQEGGTDFFIVYSFPSGKMDCTKEHFDCVLTAEFPRDCDSDEDDFEVDSPEIFELFDVSEMAKFRNGREDLVAFIDSSVSWPSDMGTICGNWSISVMFVVEVDGTISSVETLGSKKGFGLDEEAIRVIKLTSGLWTPALQRDKKVRMRMRVPVRFER